MPITKAELDREVLFETKSNGRVAVITIDRQKKLNAITQVHLFRIAELLHEIAAMPDVVVTVVTGRGRFFSAGADVTASRGWEASDPQSVVTLRKHWNTEFVANNIHNPHAWYTHPKILVVALNGPAVGISAAISAHADFIYAAPHTYLLTPFSSLGLNSEGASSKAFVDRLGLARASEALIMSRKIEMPVLLSTGYVNKQIDGCGGDLKTGKGIDSALFLDKVLAEIDDKLGPHLVTESMLEIKRHIRQPLRNALDRASIDEAIGGLNAFVKGLPQREFAKMATGQKRHKL